MLFGLFYPKRVSNCLNITFFSIIVSDFAFYYSVHIFFVIVLELLLDLKFRIGTNIIVAKYHVLLLRNIVLFSTLSTKIITHSV